MSTACRVFSRFVCTRKQWLFSAPVLAEIASESVYRVMSLPLNPAVPSTTFAPALPLL